MQEQYGVHGVGCMVTSAINCCLGRLPPSLGLLQGGKFLFLVGGGT